MPFSYGGPQLPRQKQNCHGKSKTATAKAKRSRQKQKGHGKSKKGQDKGKKVTEKAKRLWQKQKSDGKSKGSTAKETDDRNLGKIEGLFFIIDSQRVKMLHQDKILVFILVAYRVFDSANQQI